MKRGKFIVFEGIDGSGKTTCLNSAAAELQKRANIIMTSEPTKEKIGMLIRASPEIQPETEALLFTADRAEHTVAIKKWLDEGYVVLCDRYFASTLAYQSAEMNGRSVGMPWLKMINQEVTAVPELTFLFDIETKLALSRVSDRGSTSKFEEIEYLRQVRKNYLRVAKEFDFIVIDASKTKEEVLREVMGHISRII